MINPHQIYSQKLLHIYKHRNKVFLSHCLHGIVLLAFLWQEIAPQILYELLAFIFLCGLWQWYAAYQHMREIDQIAELKTAIFHHMTAGLAGLSFGLTAIFFPECSTGARIAALMMFGVIAANTLARLAALPTVYLAFLFGLTGPALVIHAQVQLNWNGAVFSILVVMMISLLQSARNIHAELMDTVLSRFGLENAAGEDKLTGLANRRRFDQALEYEWRRGWRDHVPLSLILIDVDHFKKFNDHYGHQSGDRCLAQVAQILGKSAKRACDLVARYGGEEFVILLYHMTRDDAFQLSERIRASVDTLAMPHVESPYGRVTISLGGASILPNEHSNPAQLLQTADKALYQAKENGRNRVEWLNPD